MTLTLTSKPLLQYKDGCLSLNLICPKITYTHIVAMTPQRVIGRDGGLPWHISSELKRFRKKTTGHICVMGKNTFLSLPRFLQDRRLIVLSRDESIARRFSDKLEKDLKVVGSWSLVEQQIKRDIQQGGWPEEVFIIGGAQLYRDTLPLADRLEITEIQATIPGDTYYPVFNRADYEVVNEESFLDEEMPYLCVSLLKKRG